jgi:sugar O-acyltransferase (sialic acid O-acetyltransferase NeuD family)
MRLIGVYGASGCGRGVMPLVRDCLVSAGTDCEVVFIDDGDAPRSINGHRVLNWTAFLSAEAGAKQVCVAVASPEVRERLARRCAAAGVGVVGARAANVVVMDDVVIGEGAILSPFVTLTSNIRIGRFFHANLYSYVEHDCVIGDFVTFAPAVCCNGNVVVEDFAYIGSGAVLRQGRSGAPLVIGRGAVVGMGAVVTKSVPAGVTVVGNPARPLVKD